MKESHGNEAGISSSYYLCLGKKGDQSECLKMIPSKDWETNLERLVPSEDDLVGPAEKGSSDSVRLRSRPEPAGHAVVSRRQDLRHGGLCACTRHRQEEGSAAGLRPAGVCRVLDA